MANKRYQEMERKMTYVLIADAVLFLLYLICAGNGVTGLKVLLAIVCILGSALAIGFLYMTGELLRARSRWMLAALGSIIICILVSLILNFPSPDPYRQTDYKNPPFVSPESSEAQAALPASADFFTV